MSENEKKNTWFDRNWLWVVVPLAVVGFLGSLAVFAAVIVSVVFGILKSTDPYQQAVSRSRANAVVISALGTPIKEGWFLQGQVNYENQTGNAELSIPLTGPKGSGTVYIVGKRVGGKWSYSRIAVTLDKTHEVVDLGGTAK